MAKSKSKQFPELVHLAYIDAGTEDEFLDVRTDGVFSLEPGQRCAIYKLVDEGKVHGPKSFRSSRT